MPALHGVAHQISEEQMDRIKETEGGGGNKDMGAHVSWPGTTGMKHHVKADSCLRQCGPKLKWSAVCAMCALRCGEQSTANPLMLSGSCTALWVTQYVLLAGYQLVEVDCEFYDGQKVRRPPSNDDDLSLHQ